MINNYVTLRNEVLLIFVYLICSGTKDHDPEDKKHTEPDLPDDGGVGLDLVQ